MFRAGIALLCLTFAQFLCAGCSSKHQFTGESASLLVGQPAHNPLVIVEVDGEQAHSRKLSRVFPGARGIVCVDGKAFVQQPDSVIRYDVQSEETQELARTPLANFQHQLAAANGALFTVSATQAIGAPQPNILQIDCVSGETRQLTSATCTEDTALASDGRCIAYMASNGTLGVYDTRLQSIHTFPMAGPDSDQQVVAMIRGVVVFQPRVGAPPTQRADALCVTDYADNELCSRLTHNGYYAIVEFSGKVWGITSTYCPMIAADTQFREIGGTDAFELKGIIQPDVVVINSVR